MPHSSIRGAAGTEEAGTVTPLSERRGGVEALLGNLPGMAYRCRNDARCTVLFVSEGCRDLLGFAPERFVGPEAIDYEQLVHPDDRATVRGRIEAALAERGNFELRYRVRTATGGEKWVSDVGRGVSSPDGTLETIVGFVADITELKRTEAKLREHDDMLTLAFSNARDMMLLARVEPGPLFRVQTVNRRYLDVVRAAGFAVSSEQLVGRTFSELRAIFGFPEPAWEPIMQRYRTVVETRCPLDYDEVTETPKGKFLGQSTISPMLDEAGVCRFVLYTSTDVTDHRRAELAARESEQKFAKVFRASPGAMAIADPEGRGFIEVNEGYVRLFGYSREEMIGRRSMDLGLWAKAEERLRFLGELEAHGSVRDMEVTRRHRDGSVHTCLLSAESLELGGRRCIVSSLYDITERRRTEEALRASEERFSKAFRAVPDAVFVTELASGRVVDVNGGCERIYGYRREECIGRTTHELNIWDEPADRRRLLAELSRHGGVVRDLEIPGRTRDGRRVDVLVSCETIELNGEPHLVTIAHDVTQQKRAEAALRESEERFSKAFRASPGAMAINDGETKKFVEVNAGFCQILGLSRQDLIGRTGAEAGMWKDENDRRRFYEALRAKGMIRDLEIVARHRDGRGVTCLLSTQVIQLGGRPHLITALHDITEQKRAEAALRESEERFSTAFRASPGAIGIADIETRNFVEVNEGFCALVGHAREELVGHSAFELGIWNQERDRQRFFELILSEGMVRDMEITVRHKDERVITCLLGARVVELGGRQNLIAALYDITERKRAEETRAALEAQLRQAQKLDALGQLAGGIAHDFNNILTGIMAYSELAVMDAERPAEVKKHLATVRRAAERASQLVRQILTFSRKNAKEREPVTLAPVVKEALKLLRSSLPKSITIEELIQPDVPTVLADSTHVHQIVMNLCTNAAHAMRQVPGRLKITLTRVQFGEDGPAAPAGLEPGSYARLGVSDTGVGMDEATLGRIFEPFFTTKEPGEGTGLGLAVVHGIVEDHDGLITVHSRVGEGTTFEVYLPEHTTASAISGSEAPTSVAGTGQRILFIDDEAVIGGAATIILQRFGYKITAQVDPRSALALFEAAPNAFDAVVTDLTMPHLDGIEVARWVLALRPNLPVLLVTGHSGAWTPEKVRALGIRGLLLKPLTTAKLARGLSELFATSER